MLYIPNLSIKNLEVFVFYGGHFAYRAYYLNGRRCHSNGPMQSMFDKKNFYKLLEKRDT